MHHESTASEGRSQAFREDGRTIYTLEERIQRLESIVTGREWRQTQTRLNAILWQEIQDLKTMPAKKN